MDAAIVEPLRRRGAPLRRSCPLPPLSAVMVDKGVGSLRKMLLNSFSVRTFANCSGVLRAGMLHSVIQRLAYGDRSNSRGGSAYLSAPPTLACAARIVLMMHRNRQSEDFRPF